MTRRLRLERLEARNLLDGSGDLAAFAAGEGEGPPRPDFHLTDVNSNSTRFNQTVSPRDYRDQVSAWYFAHST